MGNNPLVGLLAYFFGSCLLVFAILGFLFLILFVFAWAYGLLINYPEPPKVIYVYSAYVKNRTLYIHVKSLTADTVFIERVVISYPNGTVYKIYPVSVEVKPRGFVTIALPTDSKLDCMVIDVIPFYGLNGHYVLPCGGSD